MSIKTSKDLGIMGQNYTVPGVAVHKASSTEDIVAFLETKTWDDAQSLMKHLLDNQTRGNGIVLYGQDFNPIREQLNQIPELAPII